MYPHDLGSVLHMSKSLQTRRLSGRHTPKKRQLEGLPVRQLVLDHAAKEQVALNTAWQDWKAVREWSNKDWEFDKEDLIPRLQHLRINLFYRAVKKGQLQTAAQILDSLGKVDGESVETININAPELKIKIVDKE